MQYLACRLRKGKEMTGKLRRLTLYTNIFHQEVFHNLYSLFHAEHKHPPHGCPAKLGYVLLHLHYRFGKKLFSMQDKLVNNKQTHFLELNFSDTITPIDKRCMLLFNL